LEHLREKEAISAVKKIVKMYEKEIEKLEKLCQGFILRDERDADLFKRSPKIKGIGKITALGMITLIPELYTLDDKKLSKLAGVAPLCDQSGKMDGARHIQKGRPLVRHSLYMAALVARKHNETLSEVYTKMVNAGKPKKVALVALMRKLLCLFRRMAQNPEFNPLET